MKILNLFKSRSKKTRRVYRGGKLNYPSIGNVVSPNLPHGRIDLSKKY